MAVSFFTLWGLYAIVCLWTVFGSPETVPMILTVLPPLFAKVRDFISGKSSKNTL